MQPRICRESFSLINAGLIVSLIFASSLAVHAEGSSGRILIRENFDSKNRNALIAKLRSITGWTALGFDSAGLLRVDGHNKEGSIAARDLVRRATDGHRVIVMEEKNNSSDVAFSRVVIVRSKLAGVDQPPTYLLQIDFADFDCLFGDRQARDAFDVGWAVLHELEHVVNGSHDALTLDEAGECETKVNIMRRELSLPERARYFYTFAPTNKAGLLKSRLVRMPFETRNAQTGKIKRYWLLWDAEIVGGELRELATLR